MLILARSIQESLLIGEARLTILHVTRRRNGQMRVTLGIDAPREIPIRRAELPCFPSHGTSAHPHACTGAGPADGKGAGA